ncbi:YybS family protein [Christensenellaceae bacterium OttesenSCG-928-K19]|nr:YybS family protein [Christensenellaceae bacterium OttesenSCG-928-K19]
MRKRKGTILKKMARKTGTTALCVLISVALFALGYYGGVFLLMVLSLLFPMVFIYHRARTGVAWTVAAVLAFGVAVFLMAGINIAGILMCCVLPSALVVGHVMRRKMTFYNSVLASVITMLASLGILFLCTYLLYDMQLLDLILIKVEETLVQSPEGTKQLYYLTERLLPAAQSGDAQVMSELAGITSAAISSIPLETAVAGIMKSFTAQMALLLPQMAAFCVPVLGLLNYIIPRAIIKKQGRAVGKVPVFSAWGLPRHFGKWSLFLLILSYIGVGAGWNNFDYVYVIVMGFLTAVYSVQGMAFIDWALKKKIASRPGRVAIIVVTFLLGSIWNVYMWIGFFEQVVKLRKRELTANG